jgi:hypothetical protein
MDQDQSATGEELTDGGPRTPEQVREEIEQTRSELGDTVAALAEKTDVKAQAKQTVDGARGAVAEKVGEVKTTAAAKKDGFIDSAQQATPESAQEAGNRALVVARENSAALMLAGAFALGLLIGRRSGR